MWYKKSNWLGLILLEGASTPDYDLKPIELVYSPHHQDGEDPCKQLAWIDHFLLRRCKVLKEHVFLKKIICQGSNPVIENQGKDAES